MDDFDFVFQWRGIENQQLQKTEEKKFIKINRPIEPIHWTVLLANNRMRDFSLGPKYLKKHSQLWDRADLDTTFVSLKRVYLNPKSNERVGYI